MPSPSLGRGNHHSGPFRDVLIVLSMALGPNLCCSAAVCGRPGPAKGCSVLISRNCRWRQVPRAWSWAGKCFPSCPSAAGFLRPLLRSGPVALFSVSCWERLARSKEIFDWMERWARLSCAWAFSRRAALSWTAGHCVPAGQRRTGWCVLTALTVHRCRPGWNGRSPWLVEVSNPEILRPIWRCLALISIA